MMGSRRILRTVASLWFAALLLVLLLVAMACATVFESTHGSQQALAFFYRSWWFRTLLGLLAVNVAAALVVRFPFSKRQIGFVITHSAILVTLAGTLITKHFGVDGQIGIAEGETISHFSISEPALTVVSRTEQARSTIDLGAGVFGGFRAAEDTGGPAFALSELRGRVERFLPDSEVSGWEETGGVVKVEHEGSPFEIPLEDCIEKEVPVGETGYTVRVLRYLPHATVGPDNQLVNAPDRPVNPAIEVELNGPEGPERRLAFARFPDFMSMHSAEGSEDLKVKFVAPAVAPRALVPVEPVRETRVPAVFVRLSAGDNTKRMWLQKYRPRPVTVNGTPYELVFRDKQIPLGFDITLNRFRLGYYPGTRRPRSYESHITLVDAETGRTQSRVISMNNPTEHGGYSFYQSSYRQDGPRAVSFLSISRDPGQAVVYAGYIAVMAGMVVVLITRISERRRVGRSIGTISP